MILVALAGCSPSPGDKPDPTGIPGGLAFVDGPTLTQNAVAGAPLSWRLQATLSEPATVEVAITDPVDTWSRGPYTVDKDLDVWLHRWHPGETHDVVVTASTAGGETVSADLSVTAPPIPADFADIEVETIDSAAMEPGFTVMSPPHPAGAPDGNQYLVALDVDGLPAWWCSATPVVMGFQRTTRGFRYLVDRDRLVEVDLEGNVLDQLVAGYVATGPDETPVSTLAFHHNFLELPDGHVLVLSIEARDLDAFPVSENNPDQLAPATVAGDMILELDPETGAIVDSWKLLDLIEPTRIGYDSIVEGYWDPYFGPGTGDPFHGNSLAYDADLDRIWVSLRHQDAIVGIGRSSGALERILGTSHAWDEPWFDSVAHLTSGEWQYHQHGISLGPNGTVFAFDNGNYRATPPTPKVDDTWSRAVEYSLDEATGEAAEVWGYDDPRLLFSPSLGNAQYLPATDHVLVNYGNLARTETYGPTARILEMSHDDAHEVVFEVAVYPESPQTDRTVFTAYRVPEF